MVFGIDDAIMIGMAAAGAGMQFFGSSSEADAEKKAAAAAKKAAQKQNKIIKKQIIPLIQQQGDLQQKATEESKKAELLREQQMVLDASRIKRSLTRDAQLARSNSLVAANAQGANIKADSGFFGSLNQITAEENRQSLALGQNLDIGKGIFTANLAMSDYISQANQAQTKENIARAKMGTIANSAQAQQQGYAAQAAEGRAWSQLGTSLVSMSGTVSKIGTDLLFGSSK